MAIKGKRGAAPNEGARSVDNGLPMGDPIPRPHPGYPHLCNPPREGADEHTREAIVAAAPRRIVYISCDPQPLARDLDWLAAQGYAPVRVQPFDLLPQTEHVECVVSLKRGLHKHSPHA